MLMKKLKLILFLLFTLFYSCAFAQSSELHSNTNFDGDLKDNGRIIISFSSINQENIVLHTNISTIGSKQRYSLRLQYCLGEDAWFDVLDNKGRAIEFSSARKSKSNIFNVNLPKVCENKDTVWLSWNSVRLKGRGRYPEINIKDIKVFAEHDRFLGKEPEIKVRLKSQENNTSELDNLIFNHTPLPYTYPQTKRIVIYGNYLRGDIKLSISGKDANYFRVDVDKFSFDSAGFGTVAISYAPLKVGSHTATLNISTQKLDLPLSINLSGSCSKLVEVNSNLLEDNSNLITDKMIYRIPVFSEMDYQFKFSYLKEELLGKIISISYEWFRDTEPLFEMKDRLNLEEEQSGEDEDTTFMNYCVPITSPPGANYLQIKFNTSSDVLKINNMYFGSPSLKRSVASGLWSDENIWEPKGVPVMEDFVYVSPKTKLRVDDDVVCSMLVLGDSSNVVIDAGKMFYISGDIVYGRGSWFVVHQNLEPKRWSYISSPVNDAKALIYSMRKDGNETWLMKYNTGVRSKLKDYWSDYIVDPNYWLVPGRGYAVYTNQPLDVIYEGILCDSKVNYPLEYSKKDAWNLVGNPFTAPLSSKKIFEDIDQKIQGNALFFLDSENGVYNPIIIDGKEEVVLPSLKGFFVESLKENTEISFQRNNQYIPKSASYHWSNHNYLTFSISKESRSEYILMGMEPNSKYGFDNYDAHKLFGSSEDMPEVYFMIDNQELAVNVFPEYPACYDLGYFVGKEADLSLNVGNLSVLPMGINLFLEDKHEGKFYNLCTQSQIDFSAVKGSTEDRYRVHILKSLDEYMPNEKLSDIYLWSDKGRIIIYDGQENINQTTAIRVWDNQHNKIIEQEYTEGVLSLNYKFPKDSYLIDILIDDVWIKNIPIEVK